MQDRGSYNPNDFDRHNPRTWPQTDSAIQIDGQPILLAERPIRTPEPLYTDGDWWRLTADGQIRGRKVKAGGRIIARTR